MARSLVVLATFCVLAKLWDLAELIPAYQGLLEVYPYYVPNSLVNILQIAIALLVAALLFKTRLMGALENLGPSANIGIGFLVGGVAVLPLYAAFALVMGYDPDEPFGAIVFLSVIAPFAEEVIGRGFAFGLLRKIGWHFWPAALVPALVMAALHIQSDFVFGQAAGVFLITFVGFTVFSWLYERWGNNLWAPISLHIMMNLAWNIFSVGESAFAGWLPTLMQVTTILVAIALTLGRDRIPIPALRT